MQQQTQPSPKQFLPGCLAGAVVCLLLGAGALTWAWRGASGGAEIHWPGLAELFGLGYVRTTGVVVRSGSYSMPASQGGVFPIVHFEVGGKSYEFKGAAQNTEYLTPGSQVPVAYKKDDPTKAHIRGLRQATPALMLSGGGIILLAAALIGIWYVVDTRRARSVSRQS
jgi:hypothetical protein